MGCFTSWKKVLRVRVNIYGQIRQYTEFLAFKILILMNISASLQPQSLVGPIMSSDITGLCVFLIKRQNLKQAGDDAYPRWLWLTS